MTHVIPRQLRKQRERQKALRHHLRCWLRYQKTHMEFSE